MQRSRIRIQRIAGGPDEYIVGPSAPTSTTDNAVSTVPQTPVQLFAGDILSIETQAQAAGLLGGAYSSQGENLFAQLVLAVMG